MEKNLDFIQKRYGLRDKEIIELPYARFVQVLRVGRAEEAIEKKERMKEQAFLGWIIYRLQPSEKPKLSYKEWLRNFGLSEEGEKIEDIEELKRKALKTAEDIVNRDKGRRSK